MIISCVFIACTYSASGNYLRYDCLCIILGVFKGNKPVECCELIQSAEGSDRVKVNQLRGDHNQDSEYHGLAEKLVNRVIRSYKSQRLLGACI